MKDIKTINLELTIDGINIIINALGDCKYKDVYLIIDAIKTQTIKQLEPPQNIENDSKE